MEVDRLSLKKIFGHFGIIDPSLEYPSTLRERGP